MPPAELEPAPLDAAPPAIRLPEFPRGVTGDVAADAVQGLAHDAESWFVVTTRFIWKVPLGEPFENAEKGTMPFAGRYRHLGDADYHGGVLYVPLEGDRRGGPHAIGALRSDLTPIGVQPLAGARFVSWCAVDPRGPRLYTSSFDADRIQIFRVEISADHFALVFERDLVLKRRVRPTPSRARTEVSFGVVPRIQGGAISRTGQLYLSSDSGSTGVMIFDADTGVFGGRIAVPFSAKLGPLTHQEIEGIDLFDGDELGFPSTRGQIHVLLHDELPRRSYSLLHFAAPPQRVPEMGASGGDW